MRLTVDLDHFRARILQDCLAEATAAYWRQRARAFEWACPRPGDYLGAATPEQLAEAVTRSRETALACRRHAHLIRSGHLDDGEISAEVLAEVA